jgi:hypothetical protein
MPLTVTVALVGDPANPLTPPYKEFFEREWLVAAKRSAVSKAGATGLEPATSGVTGRRSNQLNYAPERRATSLAELNRGQAELA